MTSKKPLPDLDGVKRQNEIYQGGLTGARISVPVSLALLEQAAKDKLTPQAFDYVAGGAGGEQTMRANRDAFDRWKIVPRMLTNVSTRDLSISLFGTRLPVPVLLAPVGVQGILHPDAELATARAAASIGIPTVLSTVSSFSMEQVAEANGDSVRWFQLYWGKDPDLTASMLQRAERAGFTALVVTLDTRILGWRERDLQHPYLPFLLGHGMANYFSDPVFCKRLAKPPDEDPIAAIRLWAELFSNPALTWESLAFLRQHTRLPILLKGILHRGDAKRAVGCGVDGLIVSNHGGRQVDGSISSLEALPGVLDVVRDRIPVLFDSGVRRGADAFKAIALGAAAVLLGRLYAWGLAVAGEQGVRDVALNFIADLDMTLALSGYTSFRQLSPESLVREVS